MYIQIGDVAEGVIQSIKPYGAFVDLGKGMSGLLHISQISFDRITNVGSILSEGDKLKVCNNLNLLFASLLVTGSSGWNEEVPFLPLVACDSADTSLMHEWGYISLNLKSDWLLSDLTSAEHQIAGYDSKPR